MNPNSDRDYINQLDLTQENIFPKFLKELKLNPFRNIDLLDVGFTHPISVISGTNRSGKSTILMALACSHFNFQKRNFKNGNLERQTWSSLMKFTNHDKQNSDWTYFITYKTGKKIEIKRGQRKKQTKKWNGIGKKESQFKSRQVIFLDLDRVVPARNFNDKIFTLAKTAIIQNISKTKVQLIESYLSYVLEEAFTLNKLVEHQGRDIFKYKNSGEYSSYNAATGEEVLTKIIIDVVEADRGAIILIDEVELGLHPKVQRRLIDVFYNIARNEQKQFILTSHSATILSALPEKSRVFIERNNQGKYKAIANISVNAALSKMDSESYPLIDLYCEDNEARKIINKAISAIQIERNLNNFQDLINIIISGGSDIVYANFKAHQRTYDFKKVRSGYACILDGDRKALKNKAGEYIFPAEDDLHFIYSNESPEKLLLRAYLNKNPNSTLSYHLSHSNTHSLMQKMVENSNCINANEAFELCWKEFIETVDGGIYFKELKKFIIKMVNKFSPLM